MGVSVNFRDFPEVYDEYVRLAGNELKLPHYDNLGAKDFLDSVVTGQSAHSSYYHDVYSDGPDGTKADFIRNRISEYRKAAQDDIMARAEKEFPDFYKYVTGKTAEKAEAKLPRQMQRGFGGAAKLPERPTPEDRERREFVGRTFDSMGTGE